MLQHIGTEVFRGYDDKFWINELIYLIDAFNSTNLFDYVIIPDTRFINEYMELQNRFKDNYCCFRIKRKNFVSNLTLDEQKHSSETQLDNIDLPEIVLSGNIENLKSEVNEFMNKLNV